MAKKLEEWPWRDKYGDYAMVPVPEKETRSLLSIFYVYTGVLACIAVLWGGATIGTQFCLKDAVLVAIVGSAILSVIGGLTAPIGGVSKASTYLNMRFPFGMLGSKVFGTILAGISSGIGWFAVQAWLFGIIIHTLAPQAWWANVGVAAIWGGALMVTTAAIGFRGLASLSYIAVPFFMLLAGIGIMIGVEGGGGFAGIAAIAPTAPVSFGIGVTEVVGMYAVGGVITADISRYAKRYYDGSVAWIVQLMIFQVYMLVGAAMLTLVTGAANVAQALLVGGAGLGAFLMAMLGQWTTNDNNLYSGALSFSLWIPTKKSYITIGEGIIGITVAALIGFVAGEAMAPFQEFLTLLGKIIPPIGGVLLADFYLFRWYRGIPFKKRYQFKPGMKFAQVNWVGWASMIAATVLGGWVIKGGIACLNGLIIAFVLYAMIAILCDKAGIAIEFGEHTIDETGM